MKCKKVNRVREDRTETRTSRLSADLISTIEFNEDGELLAVGDKGGRIVVFQREQQVNLQWASIDVHQRISSRRKHRPVVLNTMFTSHFIPMNLNSIT